MSSPIKPASTNKKPRTIMQKVKRGAKLGLGLAFPEYHAAKYMQQRLDKKASEIRKNSGNE
jgi:hypothetical protein